MLLTLAAGFSCATAVAVIGAILYYLWSEEQTLDGY